MVGFPIGMLATIGLVLLLTATGQLDSSMLTADRPDTSFIYHPDSLSFIVAFLAGVAGMLSLTSAKSGALVGVLISVTTIPAAANVAAGIAYGNGHGGGRQRRAARPQPRRDRAGRHVHAAGPAARLAPTAGRPVTYPSRSVATARSTAAVLAAVDLSG